MIHIIGDSHALTFQNAKNVEVHWMGAATAFNLWKKNKVVSQIFRDNNSDSNRFFFCLGEIDCRIHIYNKSQEYQLPEHILINATIDSYLNYISYLKLLGNVSIMTVPPQGTQENYFEYPFYADRKHRQEITDNFNNMLSVCCSHGPLGKGIPLIDIWYKKAELVRPLWKTTDFQEDKCHIKTEVAKRLLEEYLESR
jgi:hypothetical protein